MSMYIGEALFGDGNEIAHIDLLIGSKDGPVGTAFATALASQSAGHSNLLAVIPQHLADSLVIVCGVFIHWDAQDDTKIYQYNYEATKLSIARAMKGEPKVEEITAKKDTVKHPFSPK